MVPEVEKICLYCHKQFNVIISRKDSAKFCSMSCCKKYSWLQPKFRENITNKLKGKHSSPDTEFKKGQHYSQKHEFKLGEHNSPETEFKKGNIPRQPFTSDEMKKLWKNENFRKYVLKKARLSQTLAPNKPEKELMKLLPSSFIYVGNGSFWIDSFNPDFIDVKNKKIIEMYGDFWHNLPETLKRDLKRTSIYKKHGYATLIVWEHELNDISTLKFKLERFINDS